MRTLGQFHTAEQQKTRYMFYGLLAVLATGTALAMWITR